MAATYSKPTVVPRWADTGTRTEPSELEKDTGWVPLQKPPAEYFNWLDGFTGDWLKWINERLADGPSDADVFSILNPNDATRQLQTILAGGIKIDYGLNIGFDGVATSGALSVGDVNFQAKLVGSNPAFLFDGSADAMSYDRTANRLEFSVANNRQLALATSVFKLGTGAVSTLPFDVASTFTGTLGDLTGNFLDIFSFGHLVDDEAALLHYGFRHADDATWSSASSYIQSKIDSAFKAFVRFSGDQVVSSTYNIGTHVGLGAGVRGGAASLFVDGTAAYAHSFLPRTYYGLAGALSEIGSSARPWSTIWMRDISGTDAHINATGSGGPGKLTLEAFDGVLTRGRVVLVGSATTPYLDCRAVNHVVAGGLHAYYSGLATPNQAEGFGFRNNSDVWDVTGMFYVLSSPAALRLWKQNRRVVDIAGRVGNVDDVQFTLGRGSGSGATVADLREYACVCQDFLSQDAIARADLVRISAAADQSVARTTTLAETGAIGFAVEDIGNGSIGRVATSGIVIARADGAPGVTRGNYVQASGVTGRVQNLATFGPACVGVALKTVAADEYFPLLIRFGG